MDLAPEQTNRGRSEYIWKTYVQQRQCFNWAGKTGFINVNDFIVYQTGKNQGWAPHTVYSSEDRGRMKGYPGRKRGWPEPSQRGQGEARGSGARAEL